MKKQSSGMWHRVEVVLTDVSEERIASTFRVEGKIRKSAREASVRDVKSRLRLLSSEWSLPIEKFYFGFLVEGMWRPVGL
jgi:hypothetical protein